MGLFRAGPPEQCTTCGGSGLSDKSTPGSPGVMLPCRFCDGTGETRQQSSAYRFLLACVRWVERNKCECGHPARVHIGASARCWAWWMTDQRNAAGNRIRESCQCPHYRPMHPAKPQLTTDGPQP